MQRSDEGNQRKGRRAARFAHCTLGSEGCFDALYELADRWVMEISAKDYCTFLQRVFSMYDYRPEEHQG